MSVRDFKKAAECFFDTMATFTSTELMDYRSFVKYAVFCCLVTQDRGDIKKQVNMLGTTFGQKRSFFVLLSYFQNYFCFQIINGTDILEVLHDFPELKVYVHSVYYCQYEEFFKSLSELS